MSSGGSSTTETAALNQQVEALVHESAALTAAIQQGRTVRSLLFLAVVAFVVVVCLVFYGMFNQVQEKTFQDRMLASAQKQFNDKSKHYMDHMQALYERTSGPL